MLRLPSYVSCLFYLLLFFSKHCAGQLTHTNNDDCSVTKINHDRGAERTTLQYHNQLYVFDKPKPFAFLKQVPGDMAGMARAAIQKKAAFWDVTAGVTSLALIKFDQPILDWIRKTTQGFGVGDQTHYNVLIKAGNTKVLQLPGNGVTLFYQLGQGGTSLLLAGGLWGYGKIFHDYRAIASASDIASTFITVALITQVIKRISGRESPFVSTVPGGRWKPFPSFGEFQRNTPNYDAFPSGHLATLMATITVLSDNYPEKKWIQPVGYSLMGICMWTMANIGVHWVGDYPLALAIGYLSGKVTTMRHKVKKPLTMF